MLCLIRIPRIDAGSVPYALRSGMRIHPGKPHCYLTLEFDDYCETPPPAITCEGVVTISWHRTHDEVDDLIDKTWGLPKGWSRK